MGAASTRVSRPFQNRCKATAIKPPISANGTWAAGRVGFVTDEALRDLRSPSEELITVYVPHSLAISGQVFVVPKTYVEPLHAKSSDVMKYIIAGGVTGGQ